LKFEELDRKNIGCHVPGSFETLDKDPMLAMRGVQDIRFALFEPGSQGRKILESAFYMCYLLISILFLRQLKFSGASVSTIACDWRI
jgi:hypothetical protein